MSPLSLTAALALIAAGPTQGPAEAGPTTRPLPALTTRPSKGFTITGVLAPPDRVKSVRLINREDPANFPAKQVRVVTASFDRRTGRFLAEALPPGFYDLILETAAGRIDGVNLRDTPDPFDLAPPVGPRGPLGEKDLEWIRDFVKNVQMFENKRRLLFVSGDETQAKALVEKIRDEQTTLPAPEPEAIWRVEIWKFQKQYGGWRRTWFQVLYRQRMPIRQFRELKWTFEPALGGLASVAGYTTDVGRYEVPETLDPEKGRTPY